jgi:hypothetical protein
VAIPYETQIQIIKRTGNFGHTTVEKINQNNTKTDTNTTGTPYMTIIYNTKKKMYDISNYYISYSDAFLFLLAGIWVCSVPVRLHTGNDHTQLLHVVQEILEPETEWLDVERQYNISYIPI